MLELKALSNKVKMQSEKTLTLNKFIWTTYENPRDLLLCECAKRREQQTQNFQNAFLSNKQNISCDKISNDMLTFEIQENGWDLSILRKSFKLTKKTKLKNLRLVAIKQQQIHAKIKNKVENWRRKSRSLLNETLLFEVFINDPLIVFSEPMGAINTRIL